MKIGQRVTLNKWVGPSELIGKTGVIYQVKHGNYVVLMDDPEYQKLVYVYAHRYQIDE